MLIYFQEEKRHTILYYQWMPFILMGQAILFYLPSAIWHAFNQRAGVDCDNILESAAQFSNAEKATKRDKLLTLISNQMDRFLGTRQMSSKGQMSMSNIISRTCCLLCGRRTGCYLVMLYIFVKILYIANIFFQLAILNEILRTSFLVYGIEFLRNMWFDDYWVNSRTFPRVTMCDFNVRRLGNVQRYTVQCVLPINMYTEKVYAFLWFWFFFLLIMTILNTLVWLLRFIFRSDRVQYIRNHLRLADVLDSDPRSLGLLREFVCDYLQQDGVFVMRMIGHNTNNITVTEVIGNLYTKFCEKKKKKNDDFPPVESSAPPLDNEKQPLTYPKLPPH